MFRTGVVGLWFISAGIAVIADMRSCDDQSGGAYLLPLVLFALIADRTWEIRALRISGALVSIAFFILVLYFAVGANPVTHGPCDRKGNELGWFLLLIQIFCIPVLWSALAILVAIGLKTGRWLKNI